MTQDEAIRKVLGCLRLAKSTNQAEAALAAAKAQEIIDRYKLDVNSLDYDSQSKARDDEKIMDFGADPLADMGKTSSMQRWKLILASSLARNNQCKVYTTWGADGNRKVAIIGRPSDVSTVRYLHALLVGEVQRLQKENCAGFSQTYRYQYADGVVDTIRQRLAQQHEATIKTVQEEQAGNSMALVRVQQSLAKQQEREQQVAKWVEENMNLRKGRGTQGPKNWTGGREAGRRDGQQVRMGSAKASVGRGVSGHIGQ
jgi:hypothetical protein